MKRQNKTNIDEQSELLELERFFSVNLDLLCIADVEGNFIKLNESWETTLGYKINELKQRKFLDFVHPEDLESTYDAIKMLKGQEEVLNFTNRYRCKDGSYRYIEWRSHPQGDLIYAAARDITKQVKEKETISKLVVASERFLQMKTEEIDYQQITDDLLDLCQGKYAAFNLYCAHENHFTTMAVSGMKKDILKSSAILGFDLIGRKWEFNTVKTKKIQASNVTKFSNIGELSSHTLPQNITSLIEKLFNVGETIVIKIIQGENVLGDFTIFMPKGVSFDNSEVIEIYTRQVGMLLERKRVEDSLKSQDFLLRKLSVQVPGCIYQYQQFPDGKFGFPYASQGIWDLLKVTPEQVKEEPSLVFRYVQQEDYKGLMRSIKKSFETMENWEFEFRVNFPKEASKWISGVAKPEKQADGSVIWHGYIKEVTGRKKMEKALQKSEIKFRSYIENAPYGIYIVDDQGFYKEVNKTACDLSGYSEEELLKMNLFDLTPVEYQKQVPKHLQYLLEIGQVDEDMPYIRKDGSIRYCHIRAVQLSARRYIIFKTDVTRRKLQEQELLKEKERADAANIAKSQFLANMSHEIRTPMNGIIGGLQLIQETAINQNQKDYLEIINHSANRLLSLINDILGLSKIESGKVILRKNTIEMDSMITKIIKHFSIEARQKGLKLFSDTQADIPNYILGDDDKLNQILFNLMGNAIKFTEEGQVTLRVEEKYRDTKNVTLMFSVIDTGIGIAQHNIDQIFNLFTQIDSSNNRKYEGTGLGLIISRRLVEAMGGTIKVESKEGEGSIFSFTVKFELSKKVKSINPIDRGSIYGNNDPLLLMESGGNDEKNSSISILLVEDEKINRRIIHTLLRKKQCKVTLASNGREALEICQESSFDIIFMDVQMPEMDGFEATKILRDKERNTDKHTPIIALTASAMEGDKEKCIKAGMDGYISKPVMAKDIYETIEKYIEY